MSNHRDRKLLDLAHLLHECCHCGRYITEGLEPAHQNGISAGKGQSIKGHDHRHAALCHECHAWYDSGHGSDPTGCYSGSRSSKWEMWIAAHMETFDRYWANGWLRVS